MKKLFNVKTGQFLKLGNDWLDADIHLIVKNDRIKNSPFPLIMHLFNGVNTDFEWLYDKACHLTANDIAVVTQINLNHPLNTMWNKIYNGCVYGDGEYVMVEELDVREYEGSPNKYEIPYLIKGDIVKRIKSDSMDGIFRMCQIDKFSFDQNCIEDAIEKNLHSDIFWYLVYGKSDSSIDSCIERVIDEKQALANIDTTLLLSLYGKNGSAYIGNILIEYSKQQRGEENKLNELENLIK